MAKVKLVRLRWCTCFLLPRHHLEIMTEVVELDEKYGVALSYTWGEFDRATMILGHPSHEEELVSVGLGLEWDVFDFSDRLVEICQARRAIWIDQLCLPQKGNIQKKVLASIQ